MSNDTQALSGIPSGIEHIGIRVRQARQLLGMTQMELGAASHTNQAVIQKIENGNSFRPRSIMAIADVLHVNPAWLQFGDQWANKKAVASEGVTRSAPKHNGT
jgi:transcriptional regulator with XRE-family HTH domain